MASPMLKFYNGQQIPVLGLGTWKSKPGEVKYAVEIALDVGYRHLDCAHVYGNEKEVGEGIGKKIKSGVVTRSDIFVTSKLWNTFHRPDLVENACRTSLTNLGLEYLDLYLMHWPFAYKEEGELFPSVEGKIQFSDVDYLDTWKAMEKLVDTGLVRSIGISNFNSSQIARLLKSARIKPVTNQVECHPYLNQTRLAKVCSDNGILVTAYSPLGSPDRPWAKPGDPQLLDEPKLKSICEKYKKSPAQILIRYQIDRGIIVIPKSVNKDRITQNFQVFDFKLSAADIAEIDSFDCNGRLLLMTGASGHQYHPFEKDDY
ncbi:aldo-keto reductase 1B-like [Arctopsyche grandis]|uniref:aldo-keto reductase 1B-like n=1 Tax=Arctopsyche grandis TaxID=121162 RepID=UPI00406DA356